MFYIENENRIIIDDENFDENEVIEILAKVKKPEKTKVLLTRDMIIGSSVFIEKVCKAFPDMDIYVSVNDVEYDPNFNESQVFTTSEMTNLFENNYVINSYGRKLYLVGYTYGDDPLQRDNKIPFSKVVQANGKMNNWVEKINNARVDGKPLSPFEKYLYAYQIVTQFKYTEDQIFEARDISRILSGKFIVCAGYSGILSELCRRVGIVCKRQYIYANDFDNSDAWANHEECVLQLKDPKYGIDGYFITDPTNDSFDTYVENGTTISHALIDLNEHDKLYNFSEKILTGGTVDQIMSNYYFLRDAGEIQQVFDTFYESPSKYKAVAEALKAGMFESNFKDFMNQFVKTVPDIKGSFDTVKYDGRKFTSIDIDGRAVTIPEIGTDEHLLANLAIKYYALNALNGNSENEIAIQTKKFLEKSLNWYLKSHPAIVREGKIADFVENISNIIKTDEKIYKNKELLDNLIDFHDLSIAHSSKSEKVFENLMSRKNKGTPTIEDYKEALKNVYLAHGNSLEEAEKNAKYLVSVSVWTADAEGWSKVKKVSNPFAKEAERTNPVENIRKKLFEEVANKYKSEGVTFAMLDELYKNKQFDELRKYGIEIEGYEVDNCKDNLDSSIKKAKLDDEISSNIYDYK